MLLTASVYLGTPAKIHSHSHSGSIDKQRGTILAMCSSLHELQVSVLILLSLAPHAMASNLHCFTFHFENYLLWLRHENRLSSVHGQLSCQCCH